MKKILSLLFVLACLCLASVCAFADEAASTEESTTLTVEVEIVVLPKDADAAADADSDDDEAAVQSAEGDVFLDFNGDKAICRLTIYTGNVNAVVTGALILTGPSSYSTSWNVISEGSYIDEDYEAYVTENGLYTLTFDGYCGSQKLNFRARGTKS
ncbi:MAG: hypothetical protein EGP89_02635 [Ruminococcaceae bacterium]|nr:hypothetical protein [Oscillospiraceae bacterium]